MQRISLSKKVAKSAFSDIIETVIIEAVMKMLKKEAEQRQAIEMLCTDMLVPQEQLDAEIEADREAHGKKPLNKEE